MRLTEEPTLSRLPAMEIRPYERERDLKAIQRIWHEIGWVDSKAGTKAVADFVSTGSCLTAAVDGEAECMAHTTAGAMRYLNPFRNPRRADSAGPASGAASDPAGNPDRADSPGSASRAASDPPRNTARTPGSIPGVSEDLPMCAVTAVMTSRVARRLGLALRVTARQVAAGARDGAAIAMLGVFDQGFYDRLGFGTGSYENVFRFDPATLRVDVPFRPPKRLGKGDWRVVHGAMMARLRGHGGCVLSEPRLMKAELGLRPGGFGLGYETDGTLTHCLWLGARNVDHGPYRVEMLAYRTGDQLLELLGLLKSLADQVSLVEMAEPPDIQLQKLLDQPIRNRRNTRKSDFAASHEAFAWWQLRVLDVAACVERRYWPGERLEFNLRLTDPIPDYLPDGSWRGCAGDYRISIGPDSRAEPGCRKDLPTLRASTGAFSRMWFGVAPASSLAITDGLRVQEPAGGERSESGSRKLLDRLDQVLCMPQPQPGWDF